MLLLSGCFTVDSVKTPSRAHHIVVGNYGWYLFNKIPLVCGNASEKPLFPWVFFRNDVTQRKIQARFMKEAADFVYEPQDLVWHTNETILFTFGTAIQIPIPYVLTYKERQLSGVLKK